MPPRDDKSDALPSGIGQPVAPKVLHCKVSTEQAIDALLPWVGKDVAKLVVDQLPTFRAVRTGTGGFRAETARTFFVNRNFRATLGQTKQKDHLMLGLEVEGAEFKVQIRNLDKAILGECNDWLRSHETEKDSYVVDLDKAPWEFVGSWQL